VVNVASTTDPTREGPGTEHLIVVGTDGSGHANKAVAWAASQALRTGSTLELVTAYGTGYVLVKPNEGKLAMNEVLDGAQAIAEKRAPGITITRRIYPGAPEGVLMEEAAGADLLVVGSRGLGGFKGGLLGSVSRKCVHRAPCPVLVIRGRDDVGDGTATADDASVPHRIVVGLDGSPSSYAATEWAARQAELTGATLDVVAAWELPQSYGWSLPIPSDWDPAQDDKELLENSLEPIRAAHPGVAIHATVVEGHPSTVLENASSGADLLVVGSRGHGEVAGVLLGSVSEHSVIHARCPVLVLRDRIQPDGSEPEVPAPDFE
jgi:nucleotide-binding universal stress UspA family protein